MEAGVDGPGLTQRHGEAQPGWRARGPDAASLPGTTPTFHDQFVGLFESHFRRLYRYLDRLSGEPELAADLAQEAFVRLYRRGSMPDRPEAWLITVAMNLFRNARSARARRRRLLSHTRGESVHSDPPAAPGDAADARESRRRVRMALDQLSERERRMLLLRAEGFSYRDIAAALELNEASVGTLLARARGAFRQAYEDAFGAP
jgi:RNA polymerase sigma-70 factor (ECF subfamily)